MDYILDMYGQKTVRQTFCEFKYMNIGKQSVDCTILFIDSVCYELYTILKLFLQKSYILHKLITLKRLYDRSSLSFFGVQICWSLHMPIH